MPSYLPPLQPESVVNSNQSSTSYYRHNTELPVLFPPGNTDLTVSVERSAHRSMSSSDAERALASLLIAYIAADTVVTLLDRLANKTTEKCRIMVKNALLTSLRSRYVKRM